jgi:tRNA pseudouridine38-40 synthase
VLPPAARDDIVAGVSSLRIRLDLAYDGSDFSGWAAQPGRRTVQGDLTAAISRVLGVPHPAVVVAGRTDAGVHALGQVCHVDLPADAWPGPQRAVRRLNAVLAPDVRVRSAQVAPEGFDARFSATSRRYVYLISDSGLLDPRARTGVYVHRRPLDDHRMADAAGVFVGEHDFAAFCKARPEASSVRRVLRTWVARTEDPRDPALLEVGITADAFCHSMVRSVVGALVAVGEGRLTSADVATILAQRRRVPRYTTAPAHGLALVAVEYPPDAELAEQARRARRFRG